VLSAEPELPACSARVSVRHQVLGRDAGALPRYDHTPEVRRGADHGLRAPKAVAHEHPGTTLPVALERRSYPC